MEDLQETQSQIDSLLTELSSLNQTCTRAAQEVPDAPFSQPEGAVMSHTEMLQVKISLHQIDFNVFNVKY